MPVIPVVQLPVPRSKFKIPADVMGAYSIYRPKPLTTRDYKAIQDVLDKFTGDLLSMFRELYEAGLPWAFFAIAAIDAGVNGLDLLGGMKLPEVYGAFKAYKEKSPIYLLAWLSKNDPELYKVVEALRSKLPGYMADNAVKYIAMKAYVEPELDLTKPVVVIDRDRVMEAINEIVEGKVDLSKPFMGAPFEGKEVKEAVEFLNERVQKLLEKARKMEKRKPREEAGTQEKEGHGEKTSEEERREQEVIVPIGMLYTAMVKAAGRESEEGGSQRSEAGKTSEKAEEKTGEKAEEKPRVQAVIVPANVAYGVFTGQRPVKREKKAESFSLMYI